MTRIACIGEAMIELSMTGSNAHVGVAGDTLNTAIYLKRAAPALKVDFMTRLGDDPFSQRIFDFIAAQEIECAAIARDPGKTPGLYAITTRADGERSFTYWRDSSAARGLFGRHDFTGVESYDAVYLSGITMAILPPNVRDSLIDYLNATDVQVIYDSNHRPSLWNNAQAARDTNTRLWRRADIALPSIDDEMQIFGETAEEVEARFAKLDATGALKRGDIGPMSVGSVVDDTYPAAANAVDTTAAGDSFNGAYIAAHLTGVSQIGALMQGHMCAREVI